MIQRKRVTVSVEPSLLQEVDTFVAGHQEFDRSKVFDEALALWYAARQQEAMVEQYSQSPTEQEAAEIDAWRDIQEASAAAVFTRE